MTQLGKYELHEQIGKGGFGVVYRAIDTTLVREVALKVLHPQLTTEPDFLERFRNEARMVASLDSPSIVTIYEMGEVDGRVFIAMKYLSGGSLKERLEKEGALPFDEAVKIMGEICVGLEVAHKKGLVHRDIKPANILFDSDGHAVLGDFGLAKAIRASSSSGENSGVGAGTPAYRAPELWRGKPPASPATDVYSLGCVFYEMLTGKVLFDGNTPDEIITQHLMVGPVFLDRFSGEIPEGVKTIVEKAVQKQPQERYRSISELSRALETIISGAKKEKQESLGPALLGSTDNEKNEREKKGEHSYLLIWQVVAGVAILGLLVSVIYLVINNRNSGSSGAIASQISTGTTTIEAVVSDSVPMIVQTQSETSEGTEPYKPVLGIGSKQVSPKDGMTMMYVPAGNFLMGSLVGVGDNDEHPQHTVHLDAYWIDQTEVTNGMYELCVNAGECTEPSSNTSYTRSSYYGNASFADYPVINVERDQALAYCQWAGRQLPTEAQWEKAARGTNGQTYPWGNNDPDVTSANYKRNVGDTTKVGSYLVGVSPFGALDMAGNVWEWVADWYAAGYYLSSPTENPTGPVAGQFLILRGGSYLDNERSLRSSNRLNYYPSTSSYNIGFRCSLSAKVSP